MYAHEVVDVKVAVGKMTPRSKHAGSETRKWAMRLDKSTKTNQPKRAAALFNRHPEVGEFMFHTPMLVHLLDHTHLHCFGCRKLKSCSATS